MTEDISAELADGSEYETDERKPDMPDTFAESDLQYLAVVGERRGKETIKLRPVTNGETMLAGSVDKNVANGVHRDERTKGGKGGQVYELLVPAHMDGVEAGDRYTIEEVLGVDDTEDTPEPRDTDFGETESAVSERDTDDSETEFAADGGTTLTEPLTDSLVSDRLQQHDDPEHEDGNTVADVVDAWGAVQEVLRSGLDQHVEYHHAVYEDRALVVFDTGTTHDDQEIAYEEAGVDDDILADILDGLMHDVARDQSDHDWGTTYPLVVTKSREQKRMESYVRQRLGQLTVERGGAARALDYWATKVQGLTFEQWSAESGRSTGAIGNSISRARRDSL